MSTRCGLTTLAICMSLVCRVNSKCYISMPKTFYENQQGPTSEKSPNFTRLESFIQLKKSDSQLRILTANEDDEALRSANLTMSPTAAGPQTLVTKSSDFFSGPVVELSYGNVEGVAGGEGTVHKFLGIPFAEAPLGDLRFKHPVPIKALKSRVIKAHHKPFPCLQAPFYINSNLTIDTSNSSEDCLYLNVWTPDNCVMSNRTCQRSKSVMVFIYGGTYTFGSSGWDMYDGEQLALRGDVVVVTFNYRVGPLGFLFAANEDAPGNAGLFDQLMALKWVQNHVEKFGGNPADVTLFGQSAGAISIAYHMLSPLSRGLFHKVIMQSGSAFFRLTNPTQEGPKKVERLANSMNCLQDGESIETHAKAIISCLRKQNGTQLVETASSVFGLDALTFFPIHGDEFLPEPANKLVESAKLSKVNVLIGNNKDEGSYFIYYLFGRSLNLEDLSMVTPYEIDLSVTFGLQRLLQSNVRQIRAQYFNDIKENDTLQMLRQAAEIVGDLAMVCPTKYFAENAALQNLSVHYYEFDYRSSFSSWPHWVGTTHGEEIPFVFGHPLSGLERNANTQDKEVSKEIIKIWTDFAKTGNTPATVRGSPWPVYNNNSQTFLRFGREATGIGRGPNERNCNLWRKYLLI